MGQYRAVDVTGVMLVFSPSFKKNPHFRAADSWKGRFTVLFVQFMNDLRPVTSRSCPTQPSVCKLGKPRSRNGSYSARVDNIRCKMHR